MEKEIVTAAPALISLLEDIFSLLGMPLLLPLLHFQLWGAATMPDSEDPLLNH